MDRIEKQQKPLKFGAAIRALDGDAGKLTRIVMDARNHQPTDLKAPA